MLRFLKSQLSGTFEILEAVDGQQAVEKAASARMGIRNGRKRGIG